MSTTRSSRRTEADDGFDPRDFAPAGTRFDRDRPYPADPRPRRPGIYRSRRFWALVGLGVVAVTTVVLLAASASVWTTDDASDTATSQVPVSDVSASTPSSAATVPEAPAASPAGGQAIATADIAPPPAGADVELPADPNPRADPDLRAATAFAVQFANTYLSYDAEAPDVRQQRLGEYLAEGLDPQLGWSGQGRQAAGLTIPLDAEHTVDGRVEVVVAAQVTGPRAPRWVHLAVTLDIDDAGRWAVVGQPAFVPPPPAGRPDLPTTTPVDEELSEALTTDLTRVMAAYGSDRTVQLAGLTAPDSPIPGLGGQFGLAEVIDVAVHQGDLEARTATVTVQWDSEVTGGTLTQPYSVTLVDHDGAWLVTAIDPG